MAKGDDLAQDDNGLMIYFGRPRHFLMMTLMLARDTSDSDTLAELLTTRAQSNKLQQALSAIGALTMTTPDLAVVAAGLQAAAALGEVAYELVRASHPTCLGLYRASWLGVRDGFGVGRHPYSGEALVDDFRFAYEIVEDRAAQ